MQETGKVVRIAGQRAFIMLEQNEMCEKCGRCELDKNGNLILDLDQTIPVNIGDEVEVYVKTPVFERALLIAYMIPFGCMLLGMVVGYHVPGWFYVPLKPPLCAAILGLIMVFFSFAVLKAFDPVLHISAKFAPRILRVITPLGQETIQ